MNDYISTYEIARPSTHLPPLSQQTTKHTEKSITEPASSMINASHSLTQASGAYLVQFLSSRRHSTSCAGLRLKALLLYFEHYFQGQPRPSAMHRHTALIIPMLRCWCWHHHHHYHTRTHTVTVIHTHCVSWNPVPGAILGHIHLARPIPSVTPLPPFKQAFLRALPSCMCGHHSQHKEACNSEPAHATPRV